jgi:hypothetical protein
MSATKVLSPPNGRLEWVKEIVYIDESSKLAINKFSKNYVAKEGMDIGY